MLAVAWKSPYPLLFVILNISVPFNPKPMLWFADDCKNIPVAVSLQNECDGVDAEPFAVLINLVQLYKSPLENCQSPEDWICEPFTV